MKMSRVVRSVACLLALALLLPCYAAAPVSAADVEAEVLYEFVPYDRETDMAAIKTNLFT